MTRKRLLTSILAAALTFSLAAPALAAGEKADTETAGDSYTLVQRGKGFPVRVWGAVSELGEMSLTLENSNEADAYQKIVVNVAEDTVILDAVTGESRSFDQIQMGETLYAWVGPDMTKSTPPITDGRLMLCGIPVDFTVPTYAEVESVTQTEEGLDVYVSGEVVLHLNGETEYQAAPGWEKDGVSGADIVPGIRLLSWYSAATMSLPAQAAPAKVMVFPSDYDGWVSVSGTEISINGTPLNLEGASAAKVEEGRLLAPVRQVAEALGCQVGWEPYTNQVTVTKNDVECYRFVIGGEQAASADRTVGLIAPAQAVDGVTFMALDDLIVLHNLKLSSSWN